MEDSDDDDTTPARVCFVCLLVPSTLRASILFPPPFCNFASQISLCILQAGRWSKRAEDAANTDELECDQDPEHQEEGREASRLSLDLPGVFDKAHPNPMELAGRFPKFYTPLTRPKHRFPMAERKVVPANKLKAARLSEEERMDQISPMLAQLVGESDGSMPLDQLRRRLHTDLNTRKGQAVGDTTKYPKLDPGSQIPLYRRRPILDDAGKPQVDLFVRVCPDLVSPRVDPKHVKWENRDHSFVMANASRDSTKSSSRAKKAAHQLVWDEIRHCKPSAFAVPCVNMGKGSYSYPQYNATVSHGPRPDMTNWTEDQRHNFWQYGSDGSWTALREIAGFRPYRAYLWFELESDYPVSKQNWAFLPRAFLVKEHKKRVITTKTNKDGSLTPSTSTRYYCLYPNCNMKSFTSDQVFHNHVRREHCWLGFRCTRCGTVIDDIAETKFHVQFCNGESSSLLSSHGPYGPGTFRQPRGESYDDYHVPVWSKAGDLPAHLYQRMRENNKSKWPEKQPPPSSSRKTHSSGGKKPKKAPRK